MKLQEGIGPFQESITSDTSIRFAGTTVEANRANTELNSVPTGVVGDSFASGTGINTALDEERRNGGTGIITPAGDVGGHLGCTSEVCMFAFHPSKLFKFLSSIVVSDYFVVDM